MLKLAHREISFVLQRSTFFISQVDLQMFAPYYYFSSLTIFASSLMRSQHFLQVQKFYINISARCISLPNTPLKCRTMRSFVKYFPHIIMIYIYNNDIWYVLIMELLYSMIRLYFSCVDTFLNCAAAHSALYSISLYLFAYMMINALPTIAQTMITAATALTYEQTA